MSLNWDWTHTIHALATPPGTSALAIVRVSGPQAERVMRSCCPFLPEGLQSHTARVGFFVDPVNQKNVDQVVVTYFREGSSYTGETLFEISCHGSSVIVLEILDVLSAQGSVSAEPGEFSFRAFCNGKIDLVQAEAIQELIMSKTRSGKDLNLQNLRKNLSTAILEVKGEIVRTIAHLETKIDFDEEDLASESTTQLTNVLFGAKTASEEWLKNSKFQSAMIEPLKVCLLGQPNSGKSTLFNLLAQEDRSIVHPEEGTTRDYITADVFRSGHQIRLVDTAGLRISENEVEALGIKRSFDQGEDSDLAILLVDASKEVTEQFIELKKLNLKKVLWLLNKTDLVTESELLEKLKFFEQHDIKVVSGNFKTNLLLKSVWKLIDQLQSARSEVTNGIYLSNRNTQEIAKLNEALIDAILLLQDNESEDIVISPLMDCVRHCNQILGIEPSEEVIDKIFSEFCLGK